MLLAGRYDNMLATIPYASPQRADTGLVKYNLVRAFLASKLCPRVCLIVARHLASAHSCPTPSDFCLLESHHGSSAPFRCGMPAGWKASSQKGNWGSGWWCSVCSIYSGTARWSCKQCGFQAFPNPKSRARSQSQDVKPDGHGAKGSPDGQHHLRQVLRQLQAASNLAEKGKDPTLSKSLKQAVEVAKDQYYGGLPLAKRLSGTQQAIEAKQARLKQILAEQEKCKDRLKELEQQQTDTESAIAGLKDNLESIREKIADGHIETVEIDSSDGEGKSRKDRQLEASSDSSQLATLVGQLGNVVQTMQQQIQQVTTQVDQTNMAVAALSSKLASPRAPGPLPDHARSRSPAPFQVPLHNAKG